MIYKPLIYDEEIIGKELYEKGFIEEFRWADVVSIGKYIRHKFVYGDARTKSELIRFLSKNKNFNYARMSGYIGKILKESRKDFTRTGSVDITELELKTIREIENFKWQKISLALLFLSKRRNNRGYVKLKDWGDVKIVSCISHVKSSDIEDVVHFLYTQKNKIRVVENDKYDPSHEILFVDKESKNIIFHIEDDKSARNLGNLYKEWCGGELYWCKECGKEFIKSNSNRHNYCGECSEVRRLEKVKINMKKYRNQSNVSSVII